MLCKTIVLELVQRQHPELREHLRRTRALLATLDRYARELKASHEGWKELLTPLRPGSNPDQISSEAMELAVKELEDRLPDESPQNENEESLFLDAAMLFIRNPTPRG